MGDLNTSWIPFVLGQQQVWDKDDDVPAASGYIEFYRDDARTTPKSVFKLSGNPPDYTYEEIGSVITLSSIGTLDLEGNNFVPYLLPYHAGEIDLYYYKVFNSVGQLQYDVGGAPNVPIGETPTPTPTTGDNPNLIQNGQFVIRNFSTTSITTLNTNFAYPIGDRDGWHYIRSTNACATDELRFYRFDDTINSPTYDPTGNPRYATRISCTAPDASDTLKAIEYRFTDVNRFSDPTQKLSIFFAGASNLITSQEVNIYLYKYFGSGGSDASSTPIGTATLLPPSESVLVWSHFTYSFDFGSNYTAGKTAGTNDDDYFSIQIRINNPGTAVFDISTTDFVLKLGEEVITAYPFTPNAYNDYVINKIDNVTIPDVITHALTFFNTVNVQTFTANGTYTPTANMRYCTMECWGGGGGGSSAALAYKCSGGGSGGYSRKTADAATVGTSQVVTVGVFGAGGAREFGVINAGLNGGASSVGTLCVAHGGLGGSSTGSPGRGAVLGTGDIAGAGADGKLPYAQEYSGGGGNSQIGRGGIPIAGHNDGEAAIGYGAGGSGASAGSDGDTNGGNGAPGLVVITEYINTP